MAQPGPFGNIVFRDPDGLILEQIDIATLDRLSRTHREARRRLIGNPTLYYYDAKTADVNYTLILSKTSLLGRWLEWSRPRDSRRTWSTWAWRIQCKWSCYAARILATALRTIWLMGIGTWISLLPLLCWPMWFLLDWSLSVFFMALFASNRAALMLRTVVERALALPPERDDETVWDEKQRIMTSRSDLATRSAGWFVGEPLALPLNHIHAEEMRVVSMLLAFVLDIIALFVGYMWILNQVLGVYFSLTSVYAMVAFLVCILLPVLFGFLVAWNRLMSYWQTYLIDFDQRGAMAISQDPTFADAAWWARLQIHPEIALVRPFIPWTLPSPIRGTHTAAVLLFIITSTCIISMVQTLRNWDHLIYTHAAVVLASMASASILVHAIRFHLIPLWTWSWASTARHPLALKKEGGKK